MTNFFINRYYRVVERKILSYTLIFSSVLALTYASVLSFYSLNHAAGIMVISSFVFALLYLWLNTNNKYFERKKNVVLMVILLSLVASFIFQGGISQLIIFDYIGFTIICIVSNHGINRRLWVGSVFLSFGFCLSIELALGIKTLNSLHYLPTEISLILVGFRAVFILYMVCLLKAILEKYQLRLQFVKSEVTPRSDEPE